MRLQFSTEAGTASELIRTFDHGWCSHVDAVIANGFLLGARSDGGVKIRPPGYANFARTLVVDLPPGRGSEAGFYDFLQAQLGKLYDFKAIAAFVFDRNWRSPDTWYCSELQAAALEVCGYFEFPLATPRNRVTPSDLLLAISATMNIPTVSYLP